MLLFADYETYYDDEYTLKKMTPAEYILDPRFTCHGLAYQVGENGDDIQWMPKHKLPAFFDSLRPHADQVKMVTYNALFDMCITAWRFNFVPGLMIDALGMARALYGTNLRSLSLKSLAEYLKLPAGAKGFVTPFKGLSTLQIEYQGLMPDMMLYGKQDVRLMRQAYRVMMPQFPIRELPVMDLVLRCCVQPQFRFDKALLEKYIVEVKNSKAALLAACGLEYDENGKCPELMSTAKFAKLLEDRGVVIETKTSPTTGKQMPALAKTDQFMTDLTEDADPTIAALAAARLGHKSTIEETRCQRFINIAALPGTVSYVAGCAPIPLRYAAAHTHRLGGDWNMNLQNLGRKSMLRKSLVVAEDEEVVAADESQIEARLSAFLCNEARLLREFSDDLDPYGQLGASIFGLPAPTKGDKAWRKTRFPVQGFIGKTGILGLGYGAGHDKFFTMVNTLARLTMPGQDIGFTLDLAIKAVQTYRDRYHMMPTGWRTLNNYGIAALRGDLNVGSTQGFQFGPVTIKPGVIWGPNGQRMFYPDMQQDAGGEWTYESAKVRKKIYGAKLLENITQWLARIIVMEAGVRIFYKTGLRFALQAHDELVYVVKKDYVDEFKKILYREMTVRPEWGATLPLDAEVHSGPSYGDAK